MSRSPLPTVRQRRRVGLAILRGVAESHGGELTVVSSGPGCAVELRLPARLPDAEQPTRIG